MDEFKPSEFRDVVRHVEFLGLTFFDVALGGAVVWSKTNQEAEVMVLVGVEPSGRAVVVTAELFTKLPLAEFNFLLPGQSREFFETLDATLGLIEGHTTVIH